MIRRLQVLQEQAKKLNVISFSERPFRNIGSSPLRPTNNATDNSQLQQVADKTISVTPETNCLSQPLLSNLKSSEDSELLQKADESVLASSAKRLHSLVEDALEYCSNNEMPSPITSSPKRARVNDSTRDRSKINDSVLQTAVDEVLQAETPHTTVNDASKHDISSIGRSVNASSGSLNRTSSLTQLTNSCRSASINRSGNSSPRGHTGRRDTISK
jgi:hypothetical protein